MKQLGRLAWASRASSVCCTALLFQVINAYKLTTHSEHFGEISSYHEEIERIPHQRKPHSPKEGKSLLQLSSAELDARFFNPMLNLLKVESSSASAASSILLVEPFYEIVTMIKKQGFTPDSINMMNGLLQMIQQTLKPNLNASVSNLSASLLQTYTAGYALCDQQLASALANTAANAALQQAAADNSACRANQGTLATVYSNCQSQLANMNATRTSNCTNAWYLGQPPATATCPKMLTGENWGSYTQRFQSYFASLQTNISNATSSCQNFSATIEAQTVTCNAANASLVSTANNCNGLQATMDNAACTAYNYNLQMCANYTSCYNQFTTNYNNFLAGVNTQLNGLRSQLSALLQIECLLNTLTGATPNAICGNVTMTAQQATQQLQLTYPTPVPKVAQLCAISAVQPGSAAYTQSFYSTLPSNAPAQVCQAACCPGCSSFTCPTGTRAGVGPIYTWGNTSSACCVQTSCYCRTLNQPSYYCDDASTYSCPNGQVCTSVTSFAFGANPCQASR
jgi:hypothetical protein